jgi:(1->4)-alpha-D-glucan 1-alpha-D-glucosylmutase
MLSTKLVQLTMPGVPDIYQGCEAINLSLVDPDNRRPVDFSSRRAWLGGGEGPDATKVRLVHTALRVRRQHGEAFGAAGTFRPLSAVGTAADHCIAFARGHDVVTIATRLAARLDAGGGWADTALTLPAGRWLDELHGASWTGEVPLARVLAQGPVALLTRYG